MSRAVARPGWRDRLRRPEPAELVQVHIHGAAKQVTAVARALAGVVTVTGMSHRVSDQGDEPEGGPVIRLEVTCYPPRRGGGQ